MNEPGTAEEPSRTQPLAKLENHKSKNQCGARALPCCEMHVSHAFHMHEPGTDARIWTCDVWWAAHIGAAHICNIVWCICLSNIASQYGTHTQQSYLPFVAELN